MISAAGKIRLVFGLSLLACASLPVSASGVDKYRDASYYVTTGTVVGLTILVDFPDDQATTNYNAAAIDNMMTQVGFKGFAGFGYTAIGSLRDYFRAASNQRFDFVCNAFNISTDYNNGGDNTGYYRAPLSKTNYTVHHETAFFGVVSNALAAVQAQGFDFGTLTTNSHGDVVGMTVLYASTNYAAPGPAAQYMDWRPPTNGSTPFFTANGVSFRWYAISEVIQSVLPWPEINTASHECSHMLAGWWDMDGRTETGNGNGPFCVMSCGGGGNPQNPPLPSAYLRSMLGWIDIVDIASNTPPVDALLTSARTTCYRYRNPDNTNEYFLVELRDDGDALSAGYGLAIWHVDESSVMMSDYYGTTNTPDKHCRCQLIQADNKMALENAVDSGSMDDLYFSPNADRFDDYTSPSAHWWNGSNSCFAISQISSRSPALRFTINPFVLNASRTVRGLTNTPFSYALQTRAGIPFTLSATGLPAGLALVGNTITGTPTSAGTSNVLLTANTGASSYTYPLTIKIANSAMPAIDSPLNIAVTFPGCYFRYDITATGATPMTYDYTNGPAPPRNILLSGGAFANGTFSGTLSGVGTFTNNLTITASNQFGCDTQVLYFALLPSAMPDIANGASIPPTGHVGTTCNFAFAYPDNPAPVFAVTSGALPPGLSLSYDGVLSGMPTATGSYTGVITAGNVSSSVFTQVFAIVIAPASSCLLTVVNDGNGQSSLGGFLPIATASVLPGTTTQIIYTADDWHRILSLASNQVSVGLSAGTRVYTQAFIAVSADISNHVVFALALTNQTGYPNVPTTWLTNWAEESVISDSAFDVQTKYLLGLNPATSNTYSLHIESAAVSGSNIVTVIKRVYSGGLSPDGMHGYLLLQATDNLGTAFTNLSSTEITGVTVFDTSDRKAYTNAIGNTCQFLRAVIQ